MESVSVRDVRADGNARIHVGNSSVTHVHHYADQDRPETPPLPFALIPFSRDLDFVSRGDILDQVAGHCAQTGRAALVGLGGVGKSQLVIEHAHRTIEANKDTWVFWVHAGTRARVEDGFRAIADAVKLQGRNKPSANIPQLLHAWLSNERNGNWLMVLDSADDSDVFYSAEQPLAGFLPQSRNGSIVVTTRDQALAFRLTGNAQSILKIGPMQPDEAVTLLTRKLGSASGSAEANMTLVKALDCIPLAVNQAASYIQMRAPRCNVEKYLAEFREGDRKSAKLLAHDAAELRRDGSSSNAIMKTWQISFDHIREKQQSAADLLSLMSFFDNQSIPEAALNPEEEYDSDCDSDLESNGDADELANQFSAMHLVNAKKRRERLKAKDDEWDSDSDGDEAGSFEDDVAILRNFCLISVNEAGDQFEMHKLVQLATKKWLAAAKEHEKFKQLFIYRLAITIPPPTNLNRDKFRDFMAHMHIARTLRPNKTTTRSLCSIRYRLAWVQYIRGQLAEARENLESACALWTARKGLENRVYLNYRRFLAEIIHELDYIDESEKILDEVLAAQKIMFGETDAATISTMVALADVLVSRGEYDKAEKLESSAVDWAKKECGLEDPETIAYMSRLSRTWVKQCRYKEAEDIDREAIKSCQKAFGETHYQTLFCMGILAETYDCQGRYDEALDLELNILELAKSVSSPNIYIMAPCLSRISKLYRDKAMYEEAESTDKACIEILSAELGPTHRMTLDCMTCLALDYRRQGHNQQATDMLVEALRVAESTYGSNDQCTIACKDMLSVALEVENSFEEATRLKQDVLAYRKSTFGPDSPETAGTMIGLARILERRKRRPEALVLYEEAMNVLQTSLGFDHEDTLQVTCRVAYSIVNTPGREIEGLDLLRKAVSVSQTKYGAEHPTTIKRMQVLAYELGQADFLDEAEALGRRVLQAQIDGFGHGHKRTIEALDKLAAILSAKENFAEAEELIRTALGVSRRELGDQYYQVRFLLEDLGRAVGHQGRHSEAREIFNEVLEIYSAERGPECDDALRCLFWISSSYCNQGCHNDAVSVSRRIFEAQKHALGEDDLETLRTMTALAQQLHLAGEEEKGTAMLEDCVERLRKHFGSDHPDTILAESLFESDEEDDSDCGGGDSSTSCATPRSVSPEEEGKFVTPKNAGEPGADPQVN